MGGWSKLRGKRAVISVVWALMAALACVSTVSADSYILWEWHYQTDECIWDECHVQGVGIVPIEDSTEYVFTDDMTCSYGTIVLSFNPVMAGNQLSVKVGDISFTTAGSGQFYEAEFVGFAESYIEFENQYSTPQYIRDIVIVCNDSDIEPSGNSFIKKSVSYGDGGTMLGLLFACGLALTDIVMRLAERVTDR